HPPVPLISVTHLCPEVHTYLCPAVPPTCAHQCHPPVPNHQCRPPVQPSSAASQCRQSVPSGCASQCRQSVTSSDASQCRLSVPIISVTYQCRLSVLPIRATSLVLPISAL
ncbi:unnamed protein product, partial [Staurois parvus]